MSPMKLGEIAIAVMGLGFLWTMLMLSTRAWLTDGGFEKARSVTLWAFALGPVVAFVALVWHIVS